MKIAWVVRILYRDDSGLRRRWAKHPDVAQGSMTTFADRAYRFLNKHTAQAVAARWSERWDGEAATAVPRRLP